MGLINSANTMELMAGNGYSGGGKGITAYYNAIGGGIQDNANGSNIEGGWGGQMRQYQVVATLARLGGNLDVTLDYYLGAYDGGAESTRLVSLGAVSDTFNTLTLKADGWMNTDEIRIGTTLADVTVVPEPTALSLLGLSGAFGLFLRRRCAK